MGLLNFIINGGLCGFIESFDHEKEGHPYNFDNLQQTLESVKKCVDALSYIGQKIAPIGVNILSRKN